MSDKLFAYKQFKLKSQKQISFLPLFRTMNFKNEMLIVEHYYIWRIQVLKLIT